MAKSIVLPNAVGEHADEAGFLWLQRVAAVHAPNYAPQQFADLDERLDAHIDGLRVAGDEAWKLAEAGLDNEEPEDFFVAAVLALEATDDRFEKLLERAESVPDVTPGVISALGWVEPKLLSSRVKSLLEDASPFRQRMGLAACAVHRKDPGPTLDRLLTAADPALRARALRTAGELGRVDLLPAVLNALTDQKQDARFWARRSAVLLGNRQRALDELASRALQAGPRRLMSLTLVLQAMDQQRCQDLITQLSQTPDAERLRVIGAGFSGSARYAPWLIEQMSNAVLARVAGEAFVNITGADFNLDQLEAMPPEDFDEGPTEDPSDENVEVPEDVALPWPDVTRITSWWKKHSHRFDMSARYFLGSPVTTGSCTHVLKTGFQRQRIAAAVHLTLLSPGTPLFNTSASARRQQQWLERMG